MPKQWRIMQCPWVDKRLLQRQHLSFQSLFTTAALEMPPLMMVQQTTALRMVQQQPWT